MQTTIVISPVTLVFTCRLENIARIRDVSAPKCTTVLTTVAPQAEAEQGTRRRTAGAPASRATHIDTSHVKARCSSTNCLRYRRSGGRRARNNSGRETNNSGRLDRTGAAGSVAMQGHTHSHVRLCCDTQTRASIQQRQRVQSSSACQRAAPKERPCPLWTPCRTQRQPRAALHLSCSGSLGPVTAAATQV